MHGLSQTESVWDFDILQFDASVTSDKSTSLYLSLVGRFANKKSLLSRSNWLTDWLIVPGSGGGRSS